MGRKGEEGEKRREGGEKERRGRKGEKGEKRREGGEKERRGRKEGITTLYKRDEIY